MKQHYVEEYGAERFQTMWREWVAAVTRYYTDNNGMVL